MATVSIFNHAEKVESFTQGQTIFEEGDLADCLYVVQEGEVDVYLEGRVVETVGPGGVIGEMALVDNEPRSATAIARTRCRLVPVDEKGFKLYVHHTPNFALQVMRVMAARLRRMNERVWSQPAQAA